MKRIFFLILSCALITAAASAGSGSEGDTTAHRTRKHSRDRMREMFNFEKRPTLSISGGGAWNAIKDGILPFANPGSLSLKIGGTRMDEEDWEGTILRYDNNYLEAACASTELAGRSSAASINAGLWRFGAGWTRGYGYRIGTDGGLILTNGTSMEWSLLNLRDQYTGGRVGIVPSSTERRIISPADSMLLERFDGTVRFGTGAHGGIVWQAVPLFSVEARYERHVVFPAHFFWKWAGSAVLEGIGQELIGSFVDRVMESTPDAAPIVNFVLKNAFSYAVYELRKDKMNYPFDTDAPLRSDLVSVGINFTF